MIKFRVFGLPRSGTSWVANWLSSGKLLCVHDPYEWCRSYNDYHNWEQTTSCGISCTGGWLFDGWLLDVPTILLERPIAEVQASLLKLGLPILRKDQIDRWHSLPWERVTLQQLMDPDRARDIWTFLRKHHFDLARHAQLRKFNVTPSIDVIKQIKAELGAL